MTQANEIEQLMLNAMQGQKRLYQEIIPLSDAAYEELQKGNTAQIELESINQKMNEVRKLDESLTAVRTHSPGSDSQHSAKLSQLKTELTGLVQTLFDKSKRLEERVRETRDGMLPDISQHVVAAKMQKAYSKP